MKNSVFLLFILLLSANSGYSQKINSKHQLQAAFGYSKHGSGDMPGFVFSTSYTNYLSKRFSLQYGISGTINDSRDAIFVIDPAGRITDASLRYTTAGVQLGVNAGYSIVQSSKHEIIIQLGTFARYQSSSNGCDGYSIYYPSQPSLPPVVLSFDNRTPQRTLSAGGIIQSQYHYKLTGSLALGVSAGFQTDTNGDALAQVALTFRKAVFFK